VTDGQTELLYQYCASHNEITNKVLRSRPTSFAICEFLRNILKQYRVEERECLYLFCCIHLLHDGGEERLRVKEAGKPDGGWELEVASPRLEFFNSL